jgi:3-mercaptopyruvate sulfurtransferase SseA
LEAGERVALIDVRGADEFTGPLGHIEGARNVPVGELSKRIIELTALKTQPLTTI